jgi:beta propeller repeat protein
MKLMFGTFVIWGRKMENKIIFTALALICLLGSISLVSANQETRLNIENRIYSVIPPSIYNNNILWVDSATCYPCMYNLITGEKTILPSDSEVDGREISMYSNNVVWGASFAVNLYDLGTKKTIRLVEGNRPKIYGNIITYENSGIYIYDLSTKNNLQISKTGTEPRIYGNNVVYVDDNWQIYIYNIFNKQKSLIGTGMDPNIYGNVVVWVNNGNIYMRDISAHKTTQITTKASESPVGIYGDKIVWKTMDSHTYTQNIYMYSISTRKTTQITKSGYPFNPDIYGSKIVYVDARNNNFYNAIGSNKIWDLFVYDLNAKLAKPVGTIAANLTSGTRPLTVFFGYKEDGDIATSYLWNFGDGITSAHAWTAIHTYTKAGIYTVSLKVTNSAGSNTATKTKYITVK